MKYSSFAAEVYNVSDGSRKYIPLLGAGSTAAQNRTGASPQDPVLRLANKPLLSKSCVRSIYMHHMPLCVYIYIYLHTHTDRHMYCNNGISYKPSI